MLEAKLAVSLGVGARARRCLLPLVAALGLAGGALAQPPAGAPEAVSDGLRVYAYPLEHQPASEALALVRPLLSARGTVELQPGGNTIVLRDSLAALTRIVPQLRALDHPPQSLRLDVKVVQAFVGPATAGGYSPVPMHQGVLSPALTRQLRGLLRYDTFIQLAGARLDVREGENVLYELGTDFAVGFKLGTLMADKRIKLHGFRIARRATTGPFAKPERQLVGTSLHLWVDQTQVLGLAKDEDAGHALLVVVSCSRPQ